MGVITDLTRFNLVKPRKQGSLKLQSCMKSNVHHCVLAAVKKFENSYPISATPPQAIQVSVPGMYTVLVTIEA